MNNLSRNIIAGSILLSIGIALAGWFISSGYVDAQTEERYVTVKGVSERDVKADIAIWPMRTVSADNKLSAAQQSMRNDRKTVREFLMDHGISSDNIELQDLKVTDKTAQTYQSESYTNRFILEQTLMVRSTNVEKIEKASQHVGQLVKKGVILNNKYSGSGPTYLFDRLSELKPDMIAEATKNARESAEQFAHDSGSELNGIRNANQGVFVILARDKAPQLNEKKQVNKTIRVVSTIDYYLKD